MDSPPKGAVVMELNLLYGFAFWRAALNRLHNVRLLDHPTKKLFTMLNWLPTVFLAKQASKFTATSFTVSLAHRPFWLLLYLGD